MLRLEYAATSTGAQVAYLPLSDNPGPTIIYIPGLLYPVETMEDDPPYARLLHGLGSLGRLVAVERRGIGASDPVDWDGDVFAEWVGDVIAVLDAIGAPSAVVVGYAAGGIVAVRAAADHPDRVDKVVVMHTPASSAGVVVGDLVDTMERVVVRQSVPTPGNRPRSGRQRSAGGGRRGQAWDVLAGVTTADLDAERRAEAKRGVQQAMWPDPAVARVFRDGTQFIVGSRGSTSGA